MSLNTLLMVALDLAYFGIFAASLVGWLRHRGAIRRAVVLVFASTAIVLATPLLLIAVPDAAGVARVVAIVALFAQPVLVLWLVGHMRAITRAAQAAAAAAFVGLTASQLVVSANVEPGTPVFVAQSLATLAYFALVEGAAALGFVVAARQRAGASRSRLLIAAASTALFGLAVVVLLASGVLLEPGSEAAAVSSVLVPVIALVAALGYLVAFAPPRFLRRMSQQSIAYTFLRDLNALPTGSPVDAIWALLSLTVRRASGAARVEVIAGGDSSREGTTAAARTVRLPFTSLRWPNAWLELDLPEHVLFLEDDLELTGIVLERAVRAAEREAFIVEREGLIESLEAASAAKSDFLAAMSHELRTPLNAIIGFSELLREGGEDAADAATVASYAEHIHGAGLHLLELVNDVLDLARVEAGHVDLKPVDVDLDSLVRQTVATVRPLAAEKGQSITVEVAPVRVEADPARIRQVLLNLLSNAIKFTPQGGAIRVGLAAGPDGGARLTVADNGRGIAPSDQERIFEAFQQAESASSLGRHEGTGLGLALTRHLVEAHGGTVGVRSEVGVGSEFTIELPARRQAAGPSAPPTVATDRPRVLVIEDDPAARELLRHHLAGAGYAVLATESGREGLAWMRDVRPDAVLLDILLPDMDGWDVLAQAKADPVTRSIPIMVVSVVDDRQLGLALGAVDYLVKPVSSERLLEALARMTFMSKVKTRTVTALVIDADPDAGPRYRELLGPEGFRVTDAPDGATGRRRAVEERPDLILVDALLPDMDGFELADALRRDPATASIPIWLTTPAGLTPEVRLRLSGTVQGVLSRGDDALAALRAWLEAPRREAPR